MPPTQDLPEPHTRHRLTAVDRRYTSRAIGHGPRRAPGSRIHKCSGREQYDPRDFNSPALGATTASIEDYTAEVRGRPLGCFHLVTFNAHGQTKHIAAHYRPLSSLMFCSRLLRERLAGTPYGEHFLAGDA